MAYLEQIDPVFKNFTFSATEHLLFLLLLSERTGKKKSSRTKSPQISTSKISITFDTRMTGAWSACIY